jgi:peptidoglycan/LPS O-acetylase OafA/YrhL
MAKGGRVALNDQTFTIPVEAHPVGITRTVYFPGLDALRFYAALAVVVAHIGRNFAELRTQAAEYPLLNLLFIDAQTAVSLFFVLSGFLITWLLFKEKARTGTISVRQFYIRRALRIWPLYYLIVVVSLVVLPPLLGPDYFFANAPAHTTILIVFLLANLASPRGPLDHLWSISLEEQFYLVWPLVMKRSTLTFLKVTFGIIFLKLVLEPVVAMFNSDAMMQLFWGLRFECMAIGALGAYLYFHQHTLLRWIYHPLAQCLVWGVMIFCALVDVPWTSVNTLLLSVTFITLILNLATNPRPLVQIDHWAFNALGKISYGIYMYHYPLLYVVLYLRKSAGIPDGETFNAVLYLIIIGGTLLLAYASYRWFEAPFLRLKERFVNE